ncbi:MAG: DNA polymerase III subunit delta [Christensenellaceae bacterium]|jgi:DNA polymerase-3 subunit delta
MQASEFLKKIKSLDLPHIYLIIGEEAYMADRVKEALYASFGMQNEGLNETIYREKMTREALQQACLQAPAFSPVRMVYIEEVDISDPTLMMDSLLPMIPKETIVLLRYVKQPDMRKAVYKKAREMSMVIEAEAPKGNALVTWVISTAKKEGIALTKQLAEILLEITGSDMYTIQNEIKKIKQNGIAAPTLTDLKTLLSTTTEYDVFQFHNDMMDKNYLAALEIFEKIKKSRSELIRFIGLLVSKFTPMYMARMCLDAGWNDAKTAAALVERTRMKPYPARLAVRDAKPFSEQQLKAAIGMLQDMDSYLKTGYPMIVFEAAFLRMYGAVKQ